jgi:hypothetical protein
VRSAGLAGEVEARYLAGAGVGSLVVLDDDIARAARSVNTRATVRTAAEHDRDLAPHPAAGTPGEDPAWAEALSTPARDVALGAHRALVSLRRALAATEGLPQAAAADGSGPERRRVC